jgi:hypothetical protein
VKLRDERVAAATTGLWLGVIAMVQSGSAPAAAAPTTKAGSPVTQSSGKPIPIAPGAFDQDRPLGIFYRLRVGIASGNRLELQTMLFLAGNRITRTFPFGGGDVFDESRCNPDMCGRYEQAADLITVRWDDGRVNEWPYERTADGIELDGDKYRPARAMPGAALIGTWAGPGSRGGNVYTFAADGSFAFGSGGTGLGGRYAVSGLTLSLDFADGGRRRRALFAAGSGEPIELIAVEGDLYRRQ